MTRPSSHHWTRPGVAAAARLSQREDEPNLWCQIHARYRDMLLAKDPKLPALDDACELIGERLRNSHHPETTTGTAATATVITKEELLKIVDWKFAKGKERRALFKHLHANAPAAVREATADGLAKARNNDISGAIQTVAELKGVGPATASAILSLYRPELFAFMDDEVIECLYGKKRDYKLSTYLTVNQKCTELAAKLGAGWTPRRVGQTLWTASRILATGGEDLTTVEASTSLSKSKRSEEQTKEPKSRKRRKT